MQHNQAIFEKLFSRNYTDPGNEKFLKDVIKAHPYFSPARFFLLQLAKEGTGDYHKLVARAGIFFNNPHWLHFQLTRKAEHSLMPEQERMAAAPELPVVMPEEEEEIATGILSETTGTVEEITDEEITESEIEPMKIELKLPEETKDTNGDALLFEPMHLVDYFASQGIKLSEEVQPGDKLGRQLKSFTEWLKTMKKIHTENTEDLRENSDKTIEMLAEKSNIENEVLTEAMAEVFIKQGKAGKATELYQKLSLLNPAKSAYFAAKIETLKEA